MWFDIDELLNPCLVRAFKDWVVGGTNVFCIESSVWQLSEEITFLNTASQISITTLEYLITVRKQKKTCKNGRNGVVELMMKIEFEALKFLKIGLEEIEKL